MRDALYELAGPGCQIVATTHSPYMVNLGSDSVVSLCKFYLREDEFAASDTLNLSEAYSSLIDDERQHLKMLLKVDDYLSRMFFARKSVFVEGDTEEVIIRETLLRMSSDDRSRVIGNIEFMRARGKPVLISIAKYLNALGIEYHILHDRDAGTEGAEAVNVAIVAASGDARRTMVEECIEDLLGYDPPSRDKPFAAYRYIQEHWGDDFESIPAPWRETFSRLCEPYLPIP